MCNQLRMQDKLWLLRTPGQVAEFWVNPGKSGMVGKSARHLWRDVAIVIKLRPTLCTLYLLFGSRSTFLVYNQDVHQDLPI